MYPSHASGSAIRTTRASAARIQTGSERSRPSSRVRRVSGTLSSGSEELHEALLELLVALLELFRVDAEELEISELPLVGRVLHLGVAGVEPLAVRHHLLALAHEREVREELRGVRVRREARDGGGRDDERHALLRVHELDRVALLLELVGAVLATVDTDD